MKIHHERSVVRRMSILAVLVLALAGTPLARNETREDHKPLKTLYVWAGDQARVAPDFLAVIDFDEDSPRYGKVVRTVPVPGPGSAGNEPHHCHLSADKNILACGGLLALLRGPEQHLLLRRVEAAAAEDSCSRPAARSRTSPTTSCR